MERKISVKKRDKQKTVRASRSGTRQTDPSAKFREHVVSRLQKQYGNTTVQRMYASGLLQAKLKMGAPGDKYEREADSVADRVMNMPEPNIGRQVDKEAQIRTMPLADQITPLAQRQIDEEDKVQSQPEEEEEAAQEKLIQRQEEEEEVQQQPEEEEESAQTKLLHRQPEEEEEPTQAKYLQRQEEEEEPAQAKFIQRQEEEEEVQPQTEEEEEPVQAKSTSSGTGRISPAIESGIKSARGGGRLLPESTRSFFEPRFGADFSGVKVHTDANAHHLARSMNAKAFTVGRDVVFGSGQYSPDSSIGKNLLAHELVHVIQQKGRNAVIARKPDKNPAEKVTESDVLDRELLTTRIRSKMGTLINIWQEAAVSKVENWLVMLEIEELKKKIEKMSARISRLEFVQAKTSADINVVLSFAGNIAWVLGGIAVPLYGSTKAIQIAGALISSASSLNYEKGRYTNLDKFIRSDGPKTLAYEIKQYAQCWLKDESGRRNDLVEKKIIEVETGKPELLMKPVELENYIFRKVFPNIGDSPENLPIKVREMMEQRFMKMLSETVRSSEIHIRWQTESKGGGLHYQEYPKKEDVPYELRPIMGMAATGIAAHEALERLKGAPEKGAGAESEEFLKLQEKLVDSSFKVRLQATVYLGSMVKEGRLKKSIVIPELIIMLNDSNYIVRAAAAKKLAELEAVLAMPAIHKAARREKEWFAKSEMIDAYNRLGTDVYNLELTLR